MVAVYNTEKTSLKYLTNQPADFIYSMSASVCAFILTFSVFCGSTVVSALLQSPSDVRLTSYNMNLVLRWKPPDGASDGLLYTAQYKSPVSAYRTACENVSVLECDFSPFNITLYGKYMGRVQAQLGRESSAWVESNSVTQDTDTIIGPPGVSLFSNGASLEVSIRDPLFRLSTLRSVYSGATYNLSYWKKDQRGKAERLAYVKQTRVVLNDLDPWSQYCVQVQVNTAIRPSEPSNVTCGSTAGKHGTPWVAAVLAVLGMAVVVGLVVAVVVRWRRISKFLCPKDALPEYLKDSLLAPPASTVYLAMKDSHPPEERYDQVTILTGDKTTEGGEPPPPEPAGDTCSEQPDVTLVDREKQGTMISCCNREQH